jgi:hypothetical protein
LFSLDIIAIINQVTLVDGINEFIGVVYVPSVFLIKQIEAAASTYLKVFWCLTYAEATQ